MYIHLASATYHFASSNTCDTSSYVTKLYVTCHCHYQTHHNNVACLLQETYGPPPPIPSPLPSSPPSPPPHLLIHLLVPLLKACLQCAHLLVKLGVHLDNLYLVVLEGLDPSLDSLRQAFKVA